MIQTNKIPEMIDPQAMYSTNGQEAWRVLGIMAEFAVATEALARSPAGGEHVRQRAHRDPIIRTIEKAERIARLLSDAGFSVISGGGPGLMEAFNRGAHGRPFARHRTQHHAAARADRQCVSGHRHQLPLFLPRAR